MPTNRTPGEWLRSSLALLLLANPLYSLAGDAEVALTGAQETPPVTTTASGVAAISIGKDRKVSGHVSTSGVDGTAAHIHIGAPGEKGPPVVTLAKGTDGAWNVPADATLSEEQYAAYLAGKLYVNVHSAANKGGEIRGQLKP